MATLQDHPSSSPGRSGALPPPLVVPVDARGLDALLEKEWLLTNPLGAYASSTVVGCNTRRYHGLLVAATKPPLGRLAALSLLMEQVAAGGGTFELGANEFSGAFAPRGFEHLREFRNDAAPTFLYRCGGVEVIKEIALADAANAVAVRYRVHGGKAILCLWPFTALRDYHGLRQANAPHRMAFAAGEPGIIVRDHAGPAHALHLVCPEATFEPRPTWWYKFLYRKEVARGQEGFEDLYTPGCFVVTLEDGQSCQFTASLDSPTPMVFPATVERRRRVQEELAASVGLRADEAACRLAAASDAFLAQRRWPGEPNGATILAGYPWFGDWGRDTFIALPGLLLATGRFEVARRVFATFARHIADGMVPNRFDEYGAAPHYNSIDASLWFLLAADRYLQTTNDNEFWQSTLLPAADRILTAYHDGTQFDIHADADGLLAGGSDRTQLTWMDVALGPEVITPRHGKAVEVNALWHYAHRMMARRCAGIDDALGQRYARRADLLGPAFTRAFWNAEAGCLYDCVRDSWPPDASIRPNQIVAVALGDGLLSRSQQASVLRVVTQHLLTPYGLRTLAPSDGRYRRRYGGSWESRDRAYHQGTVWAWLIGPYIDALLNVEGDTPETRQKGRRLLAAFDTHLAEAGLGFVSEIFDGDAPHAPRGCVAQAWSVAEVLRAKLRVAK